MKATFEIYVPLNAMAQKFCKPEAEGIFEYLPPTEKMEGMI